MPAEITSYIEGPRITESVTEGGSQLEYEYTIKSTTSEGEAIQMVRNNAFPQVDYTLTGGQIYYRHQISVEPIGYDTWRGVARYLNKDALLETDEFQVSFDTMGDKAWISFAPSGNTTKYPAGAPDLAGAINWDKEAGKPDGYDIVVPSLRYQIRYRKAKATITYAYINTLVGLTGKVNNATFYGAAAEEMLFLGAQGVQTTDSDPEVTYHFVYSPNLTDLQYEGFAPVVSKKGHEVVWVDYNQEVQAGVPTVKPVVKNVYVHKVYETADFTALGIGTG